MTRILINISFFLYLSLKSLERLNYKLYLKNFELIKIPIMYLLKIKYDYKFYRMLILLDGDIDSTLKPSLHQIQRLEKNRGERPGERACQERF